MKNLCQKNNSSEQNDDVNLMLKLKEGDQDAFTLLFNKHCKKILDYFRYHYNPYPYLSAEDYTQEVFLKLWKSRERYNPEGKGKFSAYLLAIAANFLNDCRRKAERELTTVSFNRSRYLNDSDGEPLEAKIADEKAIDPSEALLKKELDAQIQEAINSLPKGQKEVCSLKRKGFSYKEIASILKCPLGTVYSREHRARGKLQRSFKTKEFTKIPQNAPPFGRR